MIRHHDFGDRWKTHKGIGVEEIIADAEARRLDTISVVSSGNYLGAILQAAKGTGFRVVNLVNWPLGSKCEEVLIPQKRILVDSAEREEQVVSQIPHARNVGDYTDFISNALRERASAIVADKYDFIGVGLGSGKLWIALEEAIRAQNLETKLIGVVPKGENGIFNDGNLINIEGLTYYLKYEPISIADKLSTPYTFYKEKILEAVGRGHQVIEVENPDFSSAHKIARKKGFASEASGSAGFVLYDEDIREECGIPDGSNVLVISTGNGSKKNVNLLRMRAFTRKAAFALLPLAMAYSGYNGWKAYEDYSFTRSVAISTAVDIARQIGDEINAGEMSNEELWAYMGSQRVKDKLGGPLWYH